MSADVVLKTTTILKEMRIYSISANLFTMYEFRNKWIFNKDMFFSLALIKKIRTKWMLKVFFQTLH